MRRSRSKKIGCSIVHTGTGEIKHQQLKMADFPEPIREILELMPEVELSIIFLKKGTATPLLMMDDFKTVNEEV